MCHVRKNFLVEEDLFRFRYRLGLGAESQRVGEGPME